MSIEERLADFCKSNLDLANTQLTNEYYYQSLPLCVVDAVYSIGAHYSSTRNIVIRFCNKYNLQRIRDSKSQLPEKSHQLSTSSFLKIISSYSSKEVAGTIFENRQRTSPTNGILKAEAVIRFAEVLRSFGAEYLQDRDKFMGNKKFKKQIRKIPGQKSGISTKYFYMLAGSDDFIKPDRMIVRFIKENANVEPTLEESQNILTNTSKLLESDYPHVTPKLLDYIIWNYQSGRA